jgi:hypothetical protein
MSVLRPDLMMKCVVPVIMAGIIAVRLASLVRTHFSMLTCLADLRPRCLCAHCW